MCIDSRERSRKLADFKQSKDLFYSVHSSEKQKILDAHMASEDPGWRELDILEALYLNRLDLLRDEHRRNFLSQYEYEITGLQRRGISSNPTPGCPSTSSAATASKSLTSP
jgi:hypothetical protein